MGKRLEQSLCKGEWANKHMKNVFSILSHAGNANERHDKTLQLIALNVGRQQDVSCITSGNGELYNLFENWSGIFS